MKENFRSIYLTFFLLLAACHPSNAPSNNAAPNAQKPLTVSAAVSLKDTFKEIAELYKSKTGASVDFNFGASGALQKQIETGAPVDVFASAGEKQMDELAAKNLIDAATRRDFARNKLILIVPADSKTNVAAVSDLSKPEIQKIAVGNPKTVPAGQYTDEAFEKLNLKSSVASKLIFAEDVRQVLDYVMRGETDAGVVYASDAPIAQGKIRVAGIVSEDAHQPILYPIAVVKDAKQKQLARAFVDLILSDEGQNILRKYGFSSASEK